MKTLGRTKTSMFPFAGLLIAGILVSLASTLLAGGPGGGSGGGGRTSGGSGGGGGNVNLAGCTQITSFKSSQEYNPFYPADGFAANAVFIGTDLEGLSECSSSGTGPLVVSIWYQNDRDNTKSPITTVAWPVGGAMGMTAGTFGPPGIPFTVFYTVADSSGHVILSGSQNVTTLPAL
jgi:hypothetical protein